MCGDNPLCDAQAETTAFHGVTLDRVGTIKPVEDARQRCVGNSRPGIGDGQVKYGSTGAWLNVASARDLKRHRATGGNRRACPGVQEPGRRDGVVGARKDGQRGRVVAEQGPLAPVAEHQHGEKHLAEDSVSGFA